MKEKLKINFVFEKFAKETVKKKKLITGFKVDGVSLSNENQDHLTGGH